MELVVLKPGSPDLIEHRLRGEEFIINGEDYSHSIELVSMHFAMKRPISTDVSQSACTSGRSTLEGVTVVKKLIIRVF